MNTAGFSRAGGGGVGRSGLPLQGHQCTSQPPDFLTAVLSWLLYIWPGHYLPLRMLSPLSFFHLKASESARMSSASSSRTLTLKSLSHQDTYLKSLGVKGFEVSHRGSKLSFHLFHERQCTSFSVFQRVTSWLQAGCHGSGILSAHSVTRPETCTRLCLFTREKIFLQSPWLTFPRSSQVRTCAMWPPSLLGSRGKLSIWSRGTETPWLASPDWSLPVRWSRVGRGANLPEIKGPLSTSWTKLGFS